MQLRHKDFPLIVCCSQAQWINDRICKSSFDCIRLALQLSWWKYILAMIAFNISFLSLCSLQRLQNLSFPVIIVTTLHLFGPLRDGKLLKEILLDMNTVGRIFYQPNHWRLLILFGKSSALCSRILVLSIATHQSTMDGVMMNISSEQLFVMVFILEFPLLWWVGCFSYLQGFHPLVFFESVEVMISLMFNVPPTYCWVIFFHIKRSPSCSNQNDKSI